MEQICIRKIETLFHPCKWLGAVAFRMPRFFSDETYLKLVYRNVFGKKLDLKNPQTYNEKLQWLKLYDRNPNYSKMVDKCDAKKYVASIIGEEYIIPTLAVYDSVYDIDFDTLPSQFVLKCTHDSGGVVICKDKTKLDKNEAIRTLQKALKSNFYWRHREWPYLQIKPRIIAEKYMVDESGVELKDYKWFCFNGEPKALFIASDRMIPGEETKFDFFDMDFNHLPFTNGHPNAKNTPLKPKGFEEMKVLARKLSANIPHVRVDFYDVDGKIYFGELTFYHWSGFVPFKPEVWDTIFGGWLDLSIIQM